MIRMRGRRRGRREESEVCLCQKDRGLTGEKRLLISGD